MGSKLPAHIADYLARHARRDYLLVGLIDLLPPPSQPWPRAERKRWIEAFEAVADLIYRDEEPEGEGGAGR